MVGGYVGERGASFKITDKMKEDFYFPHFMNSRNDRKLLRVRKELGVEGYGIYFMILEILRGQPEYKYPLQDLDLLADEIGTNEPKVRVVICNYQLFDVDVNEQFFSPKLIEYITPYLEKKKMRSEMGRIGNLKRWHFDLFEQVQNNELSLQEAESIAERSPSDRKLSQSKVKESKVKEINIPFDHFYDTYGYKVGRLKAEKSWLRLSDKERDAAMKAIEPFRKMTDPKFMPHPATWLNGKRWEDESLDQDRAEYERFKALPDHKIKMNELQRFEELKQRYEGNGI